VVSAIGGSSQLTTIQWDGSGRAVDFDPELKEEAVKMVVETSRSIAQVAPELGVNETTLGY